MLILHAEKHSLHAVECALEARLESMIAFFFEISAVPCPANAYGSENRDGRYRRAKRSISLLSFLLLSCTRMAGV
jgi:hypothetical protein